MPLIWRCSVKTDLPFHNLASAQTMVEVALDGSALALPEGENLAAALLAAGIRSFRRTPVSGAPRAPFCMMGACFDCLIELDGVTRQACMLEVRAGMVLSRPGIAEEEA